MSKKEHKLKCGLDLDARPSSDFSESSLKATLQRKKFKKITKAVRKRQSKRKEAITERMLEHSQLSNVTVQIRNNKPQGAPLTTQE